MRLISIVNHNIESIATFTRYTNRNNLLSVKIEYLRNKIDESKFINEIHEDHTKKVFCNEIVQEMQDNSNTLEFLLFKCNEIINTYINCLNNDNRNTYDMMRFCYDNYIREIFKLINTGLEFLKISKVNVDKILNSYYNYTKVHYQDWMFRFGENEYYLNREKNETSEDEVLRYIFYIREIMDNNSCNIIDLSDDDDEPSPIENIDDLDDDLNDVAYEDIYQYIYENDEMFNG